MGQQAGNSLYQTQMAIWGLNQRLPATGQGTQLSEAPPNSVQIPKKIAGMALSCLPCRRSGQEGIPRVPRPTGKGQPKRASVKLLPWELSRGSSKLVKLGDGSWKPDQQGLLVFLRRNWVLLVELSLQGRGFFPPMKRIMREFHLHVPQQHHPSPSLTPFTATPLQKTIKNLIIKQWAAEEASTKMNADPSLDSESQCSMPLPQNHPRIPWHWSFLEKGWGTGPKAAGDEAGEAGRRWPCSQGTSLLLHVAPGLSGKRLRGSSASENPKCHCSSPANYLLILLTCCNTLKNKQITHSYL